MEKIILTGIKPTGEVHIGNYLSAIKPALEMIKVAKSNEKFMFFLADYHALNTVTDSKVFKENCYELAATWLACGLMDYDNVVFYRQSDISEIFKLNWILGNITPKGMMNRAHAYKSVVDNNIQNGNDVDANVNMGLYNYPILMAADILCMNSTFVPVGQDQKQHVEITREIARSFNARYGKCFNLPKELIKKDVGSVVGLDGRKMSKSYNNVIPLFKDESFLRKTINKIVTDSTPLDMPKDTNCTIFEIFSFFANEEEIKAMTESFKKGIGWGDVKKRTFEVINRELTPIREKFDYYIKNPELIDAILKDGAKKATLVAKNVLNQVETLIGKL